jgi:hypothetical protein
MAGDNLYVFMTTIDVIFLCCVVGRWASSKNSVMGVRRLGFREVMGLLLRLRQEEVTTDTFQVTDHLTAESAD